MYELLLKNSRQYDINHFKFRIIYRIRIYSYRNADSYDRGRALTWRPNFSNKLDFSCHLPQKQQHSSPNLCKFHPPEDGKVGRTNCAFSVPWPKKRNLSKINIYTNSPHYDNKSGKDCNTMLLTCIYLTEFAEQS